MAVIKNDGNLSVEKFTLNGGNLYNAGATAIINNGNLTLKTGVVLNINKNIKDLLINTGSVTQQENTLEAPAGYHWNNGTLEAHKEGQKQIENQKPGSYEEVIYCSVCGVEMSRTTVTVPVVTNPVAEVNGIGYATLQEAIDAAAGGQTVTLLKDLRNSTAIVVGKGKNVVIDFNGHYFTSNSAADGAVIVVEGEATAKLTDSRGGSYLKVEYAGWEQFICVVKNNGTLTVEKITLNGGNLYNAGAAGIINNGTLTLADNVIINVSKAEKLQNNSILK